MTVKLMRWAGILGFILVVGIIVQPVGISAQFFFSLFGVITMIVIRHLPLPRFGRQVFLAIGVTVILRYLYWRATSTLPSPDDLWSFIPGIFLFGSELFATSMLLINLLVISDPIERKIIALTGDPNTWPTVDIYIPTYNEDEDIVGTTLAAAVNIDYPQDRFNVYLLDDGGSDAKCNDKNATKAHEARMRRRDMGKLCAEMGAIYVTRKENSHAKAGNMNAAMSKTHGDLIVVFDADHAPMRTFLKKTVGYFLKDPKMFLVQTPHFFLNPDPVEKNLGTFERMPSENEMFYSIIQRGLDKWDGAFFCGSGALLSRKALDEVGGFSGLSITEDCETALSLHSRGWHSIYVNEPLIAGFQPETFEAFIGQRVRWCQGMLQIFLLKNPLFTKGLKWQQKLAYTSSMMFWLFPISRLSFMIAPALFVFFNLEIYNSTIQEFVAYTVFFMIVATQMQNYIYGVVRWPWVSEVYEYLQSIHLGKSIVSVILNPRAPSFQVTEKGITLEKDHFSPTGWPFVAMFVFLFSTTAVAVYRLFYESASNELLVVVLLWSLFNLIIGGIALGAVSEVRQRRRHYRLPVDLKTMAAWLEVDGKSRIVKIKDAAIGGMALCEVDSIGVEPFSGAKARLHLRVAGTKRPVHSFNLNICWTREIGGTTAYGTSFDNPTARDRRTLAMLMFPNSNSLSKFRNSRQHPKSISSGSATVIGWFIYQTYRGIKTVFGELFGGKAPEEPAPAETMIGRVDPGVPVIQANPTDPIAPTEGAMNVAQVAPDMVTPFAQNTAMEVQDLPGSYTNQVPTEQIVNQVASRASAPNFTPSAMEVQATPIVPTQHSIQSAQGQPVTPPQLLAPVMPAATPVQPAVQVVTPPPLAPNLNPEPIVDGLKPKRSSTSLLG